MDRNSRTRRINVPVPAEFSSAQLDQLLEGLGYDPARTSWRSIRINHDRVEVDLRPKPDVKVTVTHPVVGTEVE